MSTIAKIGIALGIATLLHGCCPGASYSGPGEIRRTCGMFRNFNVHFDVSTMAPGESKTWHFQHLPEMKSVIGFTVGSRSGLTCPELKKSPLANVPVRLELRSTTGAMVASMSAPLSEWIWSYGGRGEAGCNLYAKTLYFLPSRSGRYELTFTISDTWPPDAGLDYVHIGSYASYSP